MGRFEQDAIDRADREAQLAASTKLFYHPVHAFVGAINRIGGTGFDAQGAAYAPVLVDEHHTARAFDAKLRVERRDSMARDGSQSTNPLRSAGRTLIYGGFFLCNSLRVGGAIGIAAASALGLRQRI